MASLQPKGYISSSEINPRHKDDLEELKNQVLAAKKLGLAPAANQGCASSQVQTTVGMLNKTKGTLKYHDNKDWYGKVFGTYPTEILKDKSATFTHKGDNGSEGGVIYKGPNTEGGGDDCAWVLVWKALGKDGSENKVYVETGPIAKYPKGETDWETIRAKLKDKKSYYQDKATKAEASAETTEDKNKPDVTANFSVAP